MIAVAVVVVAAISLAFAAGLYALVRAEHDEREAMDRDEAERVARRDTGDRR